ncbi:serine protease family S33 [Phytophthora cinnamomi]|uniref:serine protease family S33 n=1 Tax=Phytophthora cinnamomi TaxID=4785 RepID=UPI00355A0B3A|nr:serine protease family S33 [Phytophthora cinnamomi]
MAAQEPVKRPRLAPWKVVAVLAALVLLTPVWIAYGCLGALLTLPSRTIAKTGLQLLAVVELWFTFQVFFVDAEGEADDPWLKLALMGWLVALLLTQWKLDQLLVFHLSQKPEELRINVAGIALLATFAAVAASLWRPSVSVLSHRQILSSYSMYVFWLAYLALPATVVVAHARLWIPARYSELERLEHEIIGRNLNGPFETLKVAGLGTVHVPCTAPNNYEPKLPLVLIHGYAAGNALWACNFEDLSKHYDVYAIEWLGTGKSDRPKFTSYEWEYVNEIMVEALESWRKELSIDKFYLGGHSMGAMFATSYAVKYPSHVMHLALISPAGVGHPPTPKDQPLGLRVFRSIWNLRLTPMSVARYAGPLGPRFLRFITSVRVSVMPETSCVRRGLIPQDALAAYWYNNWALEKSGEIAMHSHLLPGAFAKRPLCEMLTPENIETPITFLYGGGPDWMSSSHGENVAKAFEGNQSVEVLLVPGAGHQLFMDNAPAFNELLLSALARS